MKRNSNKIINAKLMARFESIFRCPICISRMKALDQTSLLCLNNHHCFDLSKNGYVNFLQHPPKTKYTKQMFKARRLIIGSGFYNRLHADIAERIISTIKPAGRQAKILDAGCGEGSHLSHILSLVGQRTAGSLLGVGIDISKEGIAAAAREYPNHIWCAADIANAPFFSRQFDYILNILSPANSREFYRLLRDDGMIIKVIPESRYLMELRAVFYKETNRQVYSNKEVKTRFSEHFDLIDSERLCYRFPLKWGGLTEMKQPASKWGDFQLNGATPHQKGVTSRSFIEPLIQMTPLSWGAAKDKVEKAHEMNLNDITIDLTILLGKKRV